VESVLSGPEFSVETMTLGPRRTEVIGVTAKHLSSPPHFVEMGHDFPAPLEARERSALERATLAALEAVGFDWGPAHTELRLTPEGPVVVEINPRLAGGMIPEIVRHATGIDLLSAVIALLTERTVELRPVRHDIGAIRFLTAPHHGRITHIKGIEAARELATVREVRVDKAVGNQVRFAESALDRLGFVIASGQQRGDVIADLERALAAIEIEIEIERVKH
jgi:biotin carboxylase